MTPTKIRTVRPGVPVHLDQDQVHALNELLALIHYDDLAAEWRALLPGELGGRDARACCRLDASGLCRAHSRPCPVAEREMGWAERFPEAHLGDQVRERETGRVPICLGCARDGFPEQYDALPEHREWPSTEKVCHRCLMTTEMGYSVEVLAEPAPPGEWAVLVKIREPLTLLVVREREVARLALAERDLAKAASAAALQRVARQREVEAENECLRAAIARARADLTRLADDLHDEAQTWINSGTPRAMGKSSAQQDASVRVRALVAALGDES